MFLKTSLPPVHRESVVFLECISPSHLLSFQRAMVHLQLTRHDVAVAGWRRDGAGGSKQQVEPVRFGAEPLLADRGA